MLDLRPFWPHAFEERDERGVSAGKHVENVSLVVAHRQRTRDITRREVFHKPEKKRQIVGIDALFVDRQDERARRRVHEIVRVLDAFGNSLVRQ